MRHEGRHVRVLGVRGGAEARAGREEQQRCTQRALAPRLRRRGMSGHGARHRGAAWRAHARAR
jgi:hypothetical protein